MSIKVNVDNTTVVSDANNKLSLKLSSRQNQGLSFDANGKLIATRATPVDPTILPNANTPGNGVGPASYDSSHVLYFVGANETVSRHQSYPAFDSFIKNNDGVIMSTVENGYITGGLAYYILQSLQPPGGGT